MSGLSAKQLEMKNRELRVMLAAKEILFSEGFHAMTMGRIAEKSECPKGTLYQQFSSKEDVLVALAREAWERRVSFMRRGLAYTGPTRVRMAALSEGTALFSALHPDDVAIIRRSAGAVREKSSPLRLDSVRRIERMAVQLVYKLLREAADCGELSPTWFSLEEMTFAIAALAEGALALMETHSPQDTLDIEDPLQELWWSFNTLLDAYGWRPKLNEVDWEETLADIRKTIFPEEARLVWGEGAWYGNAGKQHPGFKRYGFQPETR